MANPFSSLISWFGEEITNVISPRQAMALPPFWYGVNKITGHCARLPLFIKRQLPKGGQDKQEQHWAYDLLLTRPNAYQTADVFKQQICGHALCWGNGRAAIVNKGLPNAELIPLMPDRTATLMVDGVKVHVTKPEKKDRLPFFESIARDKDGVMMFLDSEVMHIQGFGFDGIEGLSLVGQMKRTLGIPTEQESHAYNQTKKGFVAKMIVEAPPGMLTKEADAKEWIDGFNASKSSADNAGRSALLRNGMKATALSMSNTDSQFLEQRRFSRQDIVLMLGLDGMPGDGDSHSYNSKVMESLNYLDTGLAPWLCKFEMQVDDKILSASERRRGFFSMFDLSELLRTDPKTQAEIHSLRLANRVFNPNECREELGRNPYVGGDEYINPAHLL
jgi:HK97 family phage portal protein